jgi:hypothetical protein
MFPSHRQHRVACSYLGLADLGRTPLGGGGTPAGPWSIIESHRGTACAARAKLRAAMVAEHGAVVQCPCLIACLKAGFLGGP